jgi:hypothetical protein
VTVTMLLRTLLPTVWRAPPNILASWKYVQTKLNFVAGSPLTCGPRCACGGTRPTARCASWNFQLILFVPHWKIMYSVSRNTGVLKYVLLI